MTISRRSFLKGMFGLAATAVVAPAICKSENLMKIWVPSQKLVVGRGLTTPIFHVDESAFLGGDYDGDTISFNRIRETQLGGHISHIRIGNGNKEKYVQEFLKQNPIGQRIAVMRYPIVGDNHMGIILT